MANFQQIDQARRFLGLSEEITLEELKQAYRRLALKYHPDKYKGERKEKSEQEFKKIAQARDILLAYCAGYRYSFREKDVKRNTMDKDAYEHLKRFYDGWWADLDL